MRPPGALGGAGLELVEYVPDGAVEKRSSGGAENPGSGGDMKFQDGASWGMKSPHTEIAEMM